MLTNRPEARIGRGGLPPVARGSLSVLLNPGAWLFLPVIALPLMAVARDANGMAGAFLVAGGLMAGAALGDLAIVVIVGTGLRRAGSGAGRWVRRGLAVVLGLLGLVLLSGVDLGGQLGWASR